ncbi:membrane protein [Gordonia phage Kenosha]|uniref:Membrane protein n=3 Tax=Kenoshavirus TaxID=2842796 RepID=A0A649VAP7_9CAUD|nr:membrane protein [Gordonia phage Kenosha]YP_009853709.1 membrane protein [Gordonia phage Untouchable]YP_009853912.1 membrane protein [Gordonia phage Crocheter]WAB10435.1 membrane protein [Gordonia phage Phepper]QDH85280.1 membrane protein [Gordonia phage Kenosha]QGJ89095.1 membrane protein [Gordonia phage Untouchable]QGJ90395.1 membrane protein [Gordonia phage Crocheter]
MSISDIAKNVEKFAVTNSPAILTATAVTGTITVAVLTGQASFKAARLIAEAESEKVQVAPDAVDVRGPLETKEKVELVWTLYIPAIGVGVTTVAAIVMANQIGTRRTAAMAAAYSVSEKAFGEYREKVVTKLGEKKEMAVRDEIAQDRVTANPPTQQQIVMIGEGDVLCYDHFSGRYFKSSMENLKQAQNEMNAQIIQENYASLNDFYDQVGLDTIEIGDEFGWSVDNLVDLRFSTTFSTDQRPCIAIDYTTQPHQHYSKVFPSY